MTEQAYVELLDAVGVVCGALRGKARHLLGRVDRLRGVSARLHEAGAGGWEHEAYLLELAAEEVDRHCRDVLDLAHRLAQLCDGLLDDTLPGRPVLDDDPTGIPPDDD